MSTGVLIQESVLNQWISKQEFVALEAERCGVTPAGIARRLERGIYGPVEKRTLLSRGNPVEIRVPGPLPPSLVSCDRVGFKGERVCECGTPYKFTNDWEKNYGCPECRSMYSSLELARTRKGYQGPGARLLEHRYAGEYTF